MNKTRDSAAASAPGDFEESPLFYGRWTVEEERYAEMLIEEFRDGNLVDADFEGGPSTLRGFLATKLRCSPKRISKKFESSGYNGRMQYVRKQGVMKPEERESRRQQLEELHQEFQARRRGLPKKPIKKKRSLMSSALTRRSTSGRNSLACDATPVARDSTFQSAPAVAAASSAGAALPALNLGTSSSGGSTLTGGILDSVLARDVAPLDTRVRADIGSSAASLLAARTHRANASNAVLGTSNTLIPTALTQPTSLETPSLFPSRLNSDSPLIRGLLAAPRSGTAQLQLGSHLLAADAALKRRMENARLYSILHRENVNQTNMLLHEQINQRKKLEEILAAAAAGSAVSQIPPIEGGPNKRPRAA